MDKITIVGAGNVGSTLALLLAQRNLVKNLVMVDIIEGLAEGKALDLMQASSLLGFDCKIKGTTSYKELEGSGIVVITAGLTRKPGMDRLELLKKNALIVKEIVENVYKYAPNSFILMVTNPLDVMTYYAFKISGFERNRVFGQAGVLDGARFVYFISKEINIDIHNIKTLVLGGHGNTMLPLIRYTTINSVPVDYFLNKEILEKIIECTRKGGEEIISLLKTGSAYIAPSASCLYMIEAIVKDKKTLCTASVYLNGEYGLKDVCIGVPVKIGKNGIEEIIELSLNEEEKKALYLSASIYKESIKELPF